jgi:hypothetical protein
MHVSHPLLSTITAGGTSQRIFEKNDGRRWLLIQNTSTAEDLWLSFGKAAAAESPSIYLAPGDAIHFGAGVAPRASVYVFGGTTSEPFSAWQG